MPSDHDERAPTSPSTALGEQRVFLGDVRWETFEALLHDLGETRGRLAYDQGLLEIMSPSYDHESIVGLLGRLVQTFADELALPMRALRSTTLKRPDQRRAVEADASFYIGEHARGPRPIELDLMRDPSPDLVVEVDISRSSRARLGSMPRSASPRYGSGAVITCASCASSRRVPTRRQARASSFHG